MHRTSALAVLLSASLLAGCTTTPDTPAPPPTAATTAPAASPPAPAADWSAGRSEPTADPIYPRYGNPALDVLHYGLELAWAPVSKTLTGSATLHLRAVTALTEIKVDFSRAYQLDGVSVDGVERTGRRSGDKLIVAAELASGATATMLVRYHGTPDSVPMPSHRTDVEELGLTITKEGGLWTMQEPYGAFTWYPVNDQPSDKALYDIAVTVPAGWAGIASGTPTGRDGDTFRYTSADPVASYLTTLAVGRYRKETATGPHGIPLTYWYRPGIDDSMMKLVRRSPEYLTWLEQRFGPYPFPTGGILLVPSESGMETQQLITMGSAQVPAGTQLAGAIDGDLLHEYAHQWFGDAVTTSNWRDLWLNEGWAMYAQYLYQNERDKISTADWERRTRQRDGELRATAGPPGKPQADRFAESNVYVCPALMLHEIHRKIGDKAFFAMARDWVRQHRGTTADRAGFIAFVNAHTGRDFTALINRWLDSPTTPPAL